MSRGRKKADSFRKQIAQSMADLDAIMKTGQSFSGDNRFTPRGSTNPFGACESRSAGNIR